MTERILSPTQFVIMERVCAGESSKTIGKALGVSESTIKTHLRAAYLKLGAKNRAAAALAFNKRYPDGE